MKFYEEEASILKQAVGLHSEPVGVKFYTEIPQNGFEAVQDHRFCQLVMRARSGHAVLLTSEGITCPAAAAALGFKPLPRNLQDGSMLQGYGIFKDASSAMSVMETMPRLEQGMFNAVAAKPLSQWDEEVDVVIVEDEVEKLMWIVLAYLNDEGGRLEFSTSVLQAMCVDSTVIPFLSNKLNMSFGCYGCRDATDAGASEALLGMPGNKVRMVADHLRYLDMKAIGRSRAKQIHEMFAKRISNSV